MAHRLNGLGNLIKLLPTGTVFFFQFLSPVLSNSGKCHPVNKYLTGFLIVVCGVFCFISSFTDSYRDDVRKTHYAIATTKGFWPNNGPNPGPGEEYPHKLRVADWVHAFLSLLVFAVVSLLDSNVVKCYYPSSIKYEEKVLNIESLALVIGAIVSFVFAFFPSTRHGIGYRSSST